MYIIYIYIKIGKGLRNTHGRMNHVDSRGREPGRSENEEQENNSELSRLTMCAFTPTTTTTSTTTTAATTTTTVTTVFPINQNGLLVEIEVEGR